MKLFLALGCCLAIASVALAEPQDNQHKKKNAQQGQQQQPQQQKQKQFKPGKHGVNALQQHTNAPDLKAQRHQLRQENKLAKEQFHAEKFKAKHFELKNSPNATIVSEKFIAGKHIEGSEKWVGKKYVVFKNYSPIWHERAWWVSHHNRIILIGGGWYFWDAGFWFPAWGYDPGVAYYPYDGPIYAYNDLPPDQVIANVQTALQDQGYYQGEVDGLLGPLTRAALADYQRDHDLYTTAAIDEPTLSALGMT